VFTWISVVQADKRTILLSVIKTQREKGGGKSQADAEICREHAHPRREDRSIPAGPGKGPRRRPIRPLCPPPPVGGRGVPTRSPTGRLGMCPRRPWARVVNKWIHVFLIATSFPDVYLRSLITIMSKRDVIHKTGSK